MFTTDLFEQTSRPVTICFGRMNPPTLGHGQLLKTVSDNAHGGDYYIFATKTHKLPDNPLPYDVKFKFLQAMFPAYAEHMVYDPALKTIIQVAQWLYDQGYTELNFVAGSDRIPEFSKLLNTYNGKGQPGDKGYYIFSNINMISAGDRDPDAEGLAGISASKARAAAESGNFEDFVEKTGAGKLAKPLYDAVRAAMGVSEDIAADGQVSTSPIHGTNIEEEAAGVGVVAANGKMAKDPRYSMSITKDVKPSTPKNMLRALRLAEGPVSDIAKVIAGMAGVGTALGIKQTQQRQQDKKEQEQRRQEREKKLNDPQAQQDFENWFKQHEQQRLEKLQSEPLNEKWSQRQRKSVNCNNPKGFSQKAHCAGRKARQAGRKTKSAPISESREIELSVIPMIKKFLPIVKKELELDRLPKIKIQRHVEVHNGQATFGRFVNGEQAIYIGIADRHPVDVLRTLAHELVHWKQFTEGRIKPDSGKTGSEIENEAHAVAGVLMRHFNKKYPDAIKLDNIELHESQDYVSSNISYSAALNPVAWEGYELKPEIRDRLLKISGEFVKYLEVPGFEVLDVVLTGSMANYNWTEYSDFDLHVVTNYSDLECEDLAETFYRAKKELWNNYHDITIGGHEVEMYVEDAAKPPVSAGVFSILDNRWIKKPEYNKPEIDKSAVNAKVRDMMQQIKSAIESADSPSDIQRIKDKLRKMRRAGLDTAGEFSVENLTYKILRNMGILNKMSDIQTREQDRKLSIPESKKKIKFLRPGELRGSYTDSQLQALGFRRSENGGWYIPYDQWEQLVASKKIVEGDLIPWPKGTVKVDVSDVYDWYKLGQHISNLKGLGKHDFGKGPPQTVMAFGSEPLEHEYIKDLNKIGLKTYDIDENAEQKPKYVYRIDSEHIEDFEKSLKTYYHNKDFTISGRKDFEDSVDEIKGVYAADLLFTALYSTGSSEGDHKTRYVAIYGPGQPIVYFSNKDRDRIKNNISWLTVFDADNFFKLPSGEYFSKKPGAPVKQFKITDPFAYIKKRGWRIKFVEDLKQILKQVVKKSKTNQDLKFGAEGMGYMPMSESLGIIEGKMAELDMDLEDPEISDRQFEKIYGMTRKEARELFSRTNMWDFPDFRDPSKPLHEQGVTEGADDINNQIEISFQVNQDSTIDVTAMLDGEEVGHVNFDDSKGELIPQDLYVDPEYRGQGIAAAMYDYTKSKGYTILRGEEQSDDAVGFWAKHRPGKKVWEQGVAESLDSPYSYHWEEGDFGDLNAYAQLSDNTVLDIEFEQINVDKSQWTVGFQRDGQIHKTGKGDEQRVFATVLSAIKEFIENKQPKEVFFSAEKSEVNPESRKRLYDRLVQKYATALGYQASQSETSRETKYKLSRIREQGVAEDADYEREPLYHATLKAFEPSIMKSGLLPGGNLRMFDWSDSKFVYLSNYPDIARDFIDPGVIEPDEEHEEQIFDLMKQGGVILKIDQNKLNRNLLSSDPHFSTDADDGAETYIYSGVIPPSAIIGKEYFSINESKQGVAEENLKEFAPGPDFRDDDDRQDMPLLEFAEIIKLFLGSEYTMIDRKTSEQVSVKFDPKDRTSGHNGAVLYSIIGKKQNEYPTVNFQLIDYEQGPQVGRGRRAGTAILKTRANALKIADIIYNTMGLPQQDRRVEENFADGKNPGRKGLAKRMGVPTKASVTRLRQIAKSSSGEKQRMAHWMANMKAGKKK